MVTFTTPAVILILFITFILGVIIAAGSVYLKNQW
jgi:hypothetical protein